MDHAYQTLRQQAIDLQFKFRDGLVDDSLPGARALEQEIQKVVDEFGTQRKPRGIEERILQIQRLLDNTQQTDPPVISTDLMNFLNQSYEQLRVSLRELPDY